MRDYLESSSQPARHYLFEAQKIPDRWLIDNTVSWVNLYSVGLTAVLQVRARNLGFSQPEFKVSFWMRGLQAPDPCRVKFLLEICMCYKRGWKQSQWQSHRELIRMFCPTSYGHQPNASRCRREIRTLNLPKKLLLEPVVEPARWCLKMLAEVNKIGKWLIASSLAGGSLSWQTLSRLWVWLSHKKRMWRSRIR